MYLKCGLVFHSKFHFSKFFLEGQKWAEILYYGHVTLHYITLNYITLHYITLRYVALQFALCRKFSVGGRKFTTKIDNNFFLLLSAAILSENPLLIFRYLHSAGSFIISMFNFTQVFFLLVESISLSLISNDFTYYYNFVS